MFYDIIDIMNSKIHGKPIVRFAPSPTGTMHLGAARTALFNYLFAKKHGGKMILRIEDTDRERSKKEYEDDIKEGMSWLGISFDEEYRQSDRGEIYKKYLEQMIENGSAYVSKEEVGEEDAKEGKRSEVIRFKNPNKKIKFHDVVRGDIEFDTKELSDFVVAKDMETPLYHLAVVVDDFESGITHIIRGEDHISNTPRQILIQEAIGAESPQYAHIPLILAPDRSKLSKRHGALSVLEYRERGYLPEAVVNFMALIGWNPGGEREVFLLKDLVKEFSLEKVQKSGAIFNEEKLNWINKEHIKLLPKMELTKKLFEYVPEKTKNIKGFNNDMLEKVTPIILERINVFSEIEDGFLTGEWDYFFISPQYEINKIVWKDSNKDNTSRHLEKILEILENLKDKKWNAGDIKDALWKYASEEGRGDVLWPMRYALSGKDKSPDPFTLAEVLGKEETSRRINEAVAKLKG